MNCPDNCGCKSRIDRNEKDIKTMNDRSWKLNLFAIGQLLLALGTMAMLFFGVGK